MSDVWHISEKVMQKLKLLILFFICITPMKAQNMDAKSFDFWLGKWKANWVDQQGNEGSGTNEIKLIAGDKVLLEDFKILEGSSKGYRGTSISVFNPLTSTWHQTWMDNQGGNIIFTGAQKGEEKIFQTQLISGKRSKMVFSNIEKDSFMWDWESTEDGAKTWNLNWRIYYTRIQ